MEFNNIFVVYDPTREEQPALERAAAIAAEADSQLHVFACIYSDVEKSAGQTEDVKASLASQDKVIKAAVAPLLEKGLQVTTELEWAKDWYHAVVHASARNKADVVLKSSYRHSAGQRILNRTSDWTLIRECVCPVMLVKEETPRESQRVLAAIDIREEKASYETLNQRIIDFSKRLLDRQSAEVHFVNAHKDLASFPDRNALIKSCGVDSDRIHIKLGDPEDVIVENAKDLDVSLVVLGNSGRSGLAALINGNTVEKVVDKLECDILTMP